MNYSDIRVSSIEKLMNKFILYLFVIQLVLAAGAAYFDTQFEQGTAQQMMYLRVDATGGLKKLPHSIVV